MLTDTTNSSLYIKAQINGIIEKNGNRVLNNY